MVFYKPYKKGEIMKICVHNGSFHADDVLCVALAHIEYPNEKIEAIRTRDENEFQIAGFLGHGNVDVFLCRMQEEHTANGDDKRQYISDPNLCKRDGRGDQRRQLIRDRTRFHLWKAGGEQAGHDVLRQRFGRISYPLDRP